LRLFSAFVALTVSIKIISIFVTPKQFFKPKYSLMKKLLLLISFIGLVQMASAQCNVNATVLSAVVCNGQSNGVAYAATGGGGTPPYTYLWAPTGQTAATATGLAAGTYTVTLSDAVGCTTTSTVAITQPPVVNPNATVLNTASCVNGNDACVQSFPSGGNGSPYYYAWSGPCSCSSTQYTMCGITDNTYTVTVTDYKGCTGIDTVVVPQPPNPLSATLSQTVNVTCYGSCDGSISYTFTGGNPPYFYNSTQLPGNTLTLNNLCAGSSGPGHYVTDNAGCQFQLVWSVGTPTQIGGQDWTLNDASSCGTPNGCVYVLPSGGSPPYTYSWTPTGGSNDTACGLPAGDYICIVTDSHGCTHSFNPTTVTQPSSLSATTDVYQTPTCHGGNQGCADVTVSGGTGPYTYSWVPSGGTNATACGLTANNYFVYITDNTGCQINASAVVTQPNNITVSVTATSNVSCYGAADGCGNAVASGGTPTYNYDWNTPWNPCQLPAGNYTVTATDINGCTGTGTVTITQPNQLTVTTTSNPVSCGACTDGSITSTPTGGTPPYTYWWSTSPTQTSQAAVNLAAGTYTVCVTDSNGCQTCVAAYVIWTVIESQSSNTNFIKVYPNPFHTSATVVISLEKEALTELSIYDMVGKEIQRTEVMTGTTEIGNLPAGMYLLRVREIASGQINIARLIVQ
jgi:hypothetical protein